MMSPCALGVCGVCTLCHLGVKAHTVFTRSDTALDWSPLSNCHHTSGCAKRNSRGSQILAAANIRVVCAHVFVSQWQHQNKQSVYSCYSLRIAEIYYIMD